MPTRLARLEQEASTTTTSGVDPEPEPEPQAPSFAEDSHEFSLAENADGSTDRVALGTVSATDPEDAALIYSIAGGNDAGLFEIDPVTGALFYVAAGEDYEFGETGHELTVRASDGDLTSDTTVSVNVTDVSEAPVFVESNYGL